MIVCLTRSDYSEAPFEKYVRNIYFQTKSIPEVKNTVKYIRHVHSTSKHNQLPHKR